MNARSRISSAGRPVRNACALALAIALAACAHKGTAPVEQLTNARASIAQAETVGAAQSAPVELLSSRDKLGQAEAAVRDKEFDRARELAEQAQADAALAERKARVAKAEATAAELLRSNQQLSNEAARNTRP